MAEFVRGGFFVTAKEYTNTVSLGYSHVTGTTVTLMGPTGDEVRLEGGDNLVPGVQYVLTLERAR